MNSKEVASDITKPLIWDDLVGGRIITDAVLVRISNQMLDNGEKLDNIYSQLMDIEKSAYENRRG